MDTDPRFVSSAALAERIAAQPTSEGSPEDGIVLVPLHGLTVVTVSGKDALSFLQSKLTVDVKKWSKTGGAYGYSVDINGRVLFDVHAALLDSDTVRLWSEPDLGVQIFEALDKYIIMEKVELALDVAEDAWMVAGDDLSAIDAVLNVDFEERGGVRQNGEVDILALTRAARPARLIAGPTASIRAKLVAAGAKYVSWADWRAFEIREGFVRTGFDLLRTETIPLEAGLDLGIEYNKGCYLGQEVIERLRSRGTPNREYRRVRWTGAMEGMTPIELVDAEGREVGTLTSGVDQDGQCSGIAVIRRRALQDDAATLHLRNIQGPELTIVGPVR